MFSSQLSRTFVLSILLALFPFVLTFPTSLLHPSARRTPPMLLSSLFISRQPDSQIITVDFTFQTVDGHARPKLSWCKATFEETEAKVGIDSESVGDVLAGTSAEGRSIKALVARHCSDPTQAFTIPRASWKGIDDFRVDLLHLYVLISMLLQASLSSTCVPTPQLSRFSTCKKLAAEND